MKSSKRKVRYDRLIAAGLIAAVIIIMLVLIISMTVRSVRSGSAPDDLTSTSAEASSSQEMKTDFEAVSLEHSEIYNGNLLLVNGTHEYHFSDDKTALLQSSESSEDIHYKLRSLKFQMDKNALKALNSMMNAYYSETSDESIMLTEGYISGEQQNLMYNQALLNGLNLPKGGFSEHHTGLAFDYDITESNSSVYRTKLETAQKWFEENAADYGFIIRYPENKKSVTGVSSHANHLRYVGIPHAFYMKQNDISLEEYTDLLKNYSYDATTLDIEYNSREYKVYFAASSSDITDTEICVPRSGTYTYTISGNNDDGFIVTVEK